MRYPGAKGLMLRKTYTDLIDAIRDMWDEDILPMHPDLPDAPIRKVGGSLTPRNYIFPNGSTVRLRGLDKANRLLSGAFDFIYVNQVEELSLEEWEAIGSRCTRRASSKRKIRPVYNQIIADCNPDSNLHWIINRDGDPASIHKVFHSVHKDNPTLWTHPGNYEEGAWTKDGQIMYNKLSNMTGIRYKRGFLGEWVAATGQVYEFDREKHIIDAMPHGWQKWPKFGAIDFGHRDPFVHQWWAMSPAKDLYLYREIYMTGTSVNQQARIIRRIERDNKERIVFRVSDHESSLREVLLDHGIRTNPAEKAIHLGIEEVQKRLRIDPDTGRPRIFFLSTALHERDRELYLAKRPSRTIDEFAEYIYPDEGRRNPKDIPLPGSDHGMDAMRYMCVALSRRATAFQGFYQGSTQRF